jgi:hypothetical protein
MATIEDKIVNDVVTITKTEALKLTDRITTAIAQGKKPENLTWKLHNQIQPFFLKIWKDGWALGQDHASEELQILDRGQKGKFSRSSLLATFAKDPKDPKKPDLRKVPVKREAISEALNRILEDRSQWLGDRYSDDLKASITELVRRNLIPDADGKKLGKKDLYKLVEAFIDEEIPTGKTPEAKKGARARATLIARTELTAATSTAKLYTYLKSGKVKAVRYANFEYPAPIKDRRPCAVCGQRNGTILPLETQDDLDFILTHYKIPAHGHCQCSYVPVFNDDPDGDDPDRAPNPANVPALAPSWSSSNPVVRADETAAKKRKKSNLVSAITGVLAGQVTKITGQAIWAEIQRLQALQAAEREKQAAERRLYGGLLTGGIALSLSAIAFFALASLLRQRRSESMTETLEQIGVSRAEETIDSLILQVADKFNKKKAAAATLAATGKQQKPKPAAKKEASRITAETSESLNILTSGIELRTSDLLAQVSELDSNPSEAKIAGLKGAIERVVYDLRVNRGRASAAASQGVDVGAAQSRLSILQGLLNVARSQVNSIEQRWRG